MPKIDLVTVCFAGDLHLQKLQARSVAKFFDDGLLQKIVIIINDPDPLKVRQNFNEIVLPEYGRFASRVCFLDHDVRWTEKWPKSGWHAQQVLKLKVSRSVETDSYMILDAKNHFIRPVTAASVFQPDGRIRSHRPKMAENFLSQYHNSFELFGGELAECRARPLPTTTPFLMKTEIASALLSQVEKITGQDFESFFWANRNSYTEFCLYGAYLDLFEGGLDTHYAARTKPTATLYRNASDDYVRCRRILARTSRRDVFCVGVHRHVLEVGNREVLAAIWKTWRHFGLVREGEQQQFLLNADVSPGPFRHFFFLGR